MSELTLFSIQFLFLILLLSLAVFLIRTAPVSSVKGGLVSNNWGLWLAQQIQSGFGLDRESFLARLARLTSVCLKYGVAIWTLNNPNQLTLKFWVLVWVAMLIVELQRKAAQFHIPMKWENISLKLDSEHFWLIHLIVLGTAELHLGGDRPWGIASLIAFYILFAGESKGSLLASIEDVTSCAWATIALGFLINQPLLDLENLAIFLMVVVLFRGVIRLVFGRAWIKRRFWWVAQFCLMTSFIIKSLSVLNVFSIFNS